MVINASNMCCNCLYLVVDFLWLFASTLNLFDDNNNVLSDTFLFAKFVNSLCVKRTKLILRDSKHHCTLNDKGTHTLYLHFVLSQLFFVESLKLLWLMEIKFDFYFSFKDEIQNKIPMLYYHHYIMLCTYNNISEKERAWLWFVLANIT